MVTTLPGLEKLHSLNPNLRIIDFRILVEFRLIYEDRVATIHCTMAAEDEGVAYIANFKFTHAGDISLRRISNIEAYVAGFDVMSIHDRQLEEYDWEVVDYEGDEIHWNAREAEIVSVKIATHAIR